MRVARLCETAQITTNPHGSRVVGHLLPPDVANVRVDSERSAGKARDHGRLTSRRRARQPGCPPACTARFGILAQTDVGEAGKQGPLQSTWPRSCPTRFRPAGVVGCNSNDLVSRCTHRRPSPLGLDRTTRNEQPIHRRRPPDGAYHTHSGAACYLCSWPIAAGPFEL